jgi:hypothetical protein
MLWYGRLVLSSLRTEQIMTRDARHDDTQIIETPLLWLDYPTMIMRAVPSSDRRTRGPIRLLLRFVSVSMALVFSLFAILSAGLAVVSSSATSVAGGMLVMAASGGLAALACIWAGTMSEGSGS